MSFSNVVEVLSDWWGGVGDGRKIKSEESEPFDSRSFSVKLSTFVAAISLLVTAALVIVGAVHNRRCFLSMAGN